MNYWQGKSVTLRGIETADALFFYEWNKKVSTQKNIDQIWFPSSLVRQENWVGKEALRSIEDDGYFFVIEDHKHQPVGMIRTKDCDLKNGNFSYALGVIDEERRKGYAKEAIQLVLNYYFNELRYHKVSISVYDFNVGSIALHQKLGFREEGRLREMVFANNQFYDLLKFGLLKREFN